jgi:transposase-like protein
MQSGTQHEGNTLDFMLSAKRDALEGRTVLAQSFEFV